jgi:anti-sigma factor RsiW
MIDYQDQLKLQAYLDGELPEAEAREMANRLTRDQEAVALLTELRQTRQAVAGFEDGIRLPETREFYWSKLRREIERLEGPVKAAETTTPLVVWLRRFLVPVAGLALLVIAGLMAIRGPSQEAAPIETALADPGAMIYHDYSVGATFVWLAYPADKEIADDYDFGTFE